jgi:hypothetical protein
MKKRTPTKTNRSPKRTASDAKGAVPKKGAAMTLDIAGFKDHPPPTFESGALRIEDISQARSRIELSQGLFAVHRLAELGADEMDDDSLSEFRDWLSPASSMPLSLARARLARAVLEFIDNALFHGDHETWQRVQDAYGVLEAPLRRSKKARVLSILLLSVDTPAARAEAAELARITREGDSSPEALKKMGALPRATRLLREGRYRNRGHRVIGDLATIDPAYGKLTPSDVETLLDRVNTNGGPGNIGIITLAVQLTIKCGALKAGPVPATRQGRKDLEETLDASFTKEASRAGLTLKM